jgi:hypothetical protein
VGILIDALDEARLRVTQEAFEAFLRDVDQLSRRSMPTVLFGRTGAIRAPAGRGRAFREMQGRRGLAWARQ